MDTDLQHFLSDEGYLNITEKNGRMFAIHQFNFTWGLMCDLDRIGYRGRYCYGSYAEALIALMDWNGANDPPGRWIKYKGHGGERCPPKMFKGIAVVSV